MPASIPNDIYQYSLYSAFNAGLTDGGPPTAFLTNHGTHGIGKFTDGRTDMIQVDSIAYTLRVDGTAEQAPRDAQLPFTMVTVFQPTYGAHLPGGHKMADLTKLFAAGGAVASGRNTPMPFSVSGKFSNIQLGETTSKDVEGVIFGYMIPSWQKEVSGEGAQSCFLSKDKRYGGKVRDFETGDQAQVAWAKCGRFHLGFPQSNEYEELEF